RSQARDARIGGRRPAEQEVVGTSQADLLGEHELATPAIELVAKPLERRVVATRSRGREGEVYKAVGGRVAKPRLQRRAQRPSPALVDPGLEDRKQGWIFVGNDD